MSNPFSGIITEGFKDLFENAISALLEDKSLVLDCELIFGITRYDDCPNCIFSTVSQSSSGRYKTGGPIPFIFGEVCPVCDGAGRFPIESKENINMMVIWDVKNFINVAADVVIPQGSVQTITYFDRIDKIRRAKSLIISSRYQYTRFAEPEPCGLGRNSFFSCIWKRS
jgi:hypothetical protein